MTTRLCARRWPRESVCQSDLEVCGEAADLERGIPPWSPTPSPTWPLSISPSRPAAASNLIKRIKDRNDTVRMLVWSTHGESLYAERVLTAGALGYINKDQATNKIVEGHPAGC